MIYTGKVVLPVHLAIRRQNVQHGTSYALAVPTVVPKQIWPEIVDKVTGTDVNCRLERGVWVSWTLRLVYLVLI